MAARHPSALDLSTAGGGGLSVPLDSPPYETETPLLKGEKNPNPKTFLDRAQDLGYGVLRSFLNLKTNDVLSITFDTRREAQRKVGKERVKPPATAPGQELFPWELSIDDYARRVVKVACRGIGALVDKDDLRSFLLRDGTPVEECDSYKLLNYVKDRICWVGGPDPTKETAFFSRLRGSDMTQGDARTARCAVLALLELRNSLAHRSVFKKKEEERWWVLERVVIAEALTAKKLFALLAMGTPKDSPANCTLRDLEELCLRCAVHRASIAARKKALLRRSDLRGCESASEDDSDSPNPLSLPPPAQPPSSLPPPPPPPPPPAPPPRATKQEIDDAYAEGFLYAKDECKGEIDECKGEITKLKAEVAEKQGKLNAMVAENQRLKLLMKVETFRTEKAK
jgi:hypothetical protein